MNPKNTPNKIDLVSVSKKLSLMLRHTPQRFGIFLDKEGWTSLEAVLHILRAQREGWDILSETMLIEMNASMPKQRFEFGEGKIRALYGHTVKEKIEKTPQEPPAWLYHGTNAGAWKTIQREGLRPMKRNYVHLSTETRTASIVGLRRTSEVVMIRIDAAAAWKNGIGFYHGNQDTWLSDAIPASYLSLQEA